jgi:hypothetical protein
LKRTKETLTGSPAQNSYVLRSLLKEYELENEPDTEPVPDGHCLSEETVEKVVNFFLSDDISRPSPSSKDYVTVFEGTQKKKISVRHLMFSVKEVHGMFTSENPESPVSLSKFYKLRPPNVLSFTKIPQNVCCCEIHENIRACVKGLKKSGPLFHFLNIDYNIHKNFTCDQPTIDCFDNKCTNCCHSKYLKSVVENVENPSQLVTWCKWVKTNKTDDHQKNVYCNVEKVEKSGRLQELLDETFSLVPHFLEHQYVKLSQSNANKRMIERAMEFDSEHAVIVCDFAENFKCLQQNSTQSAHYGQTPITLFTVAVYHRKLLPLTIASNCEKHTKDSIFAYLDELLQLLPNTAKIVDFWSDNATSQFKNQFNLEAMKKFEFRYPALKIKWNFYAPMHGKSVVDGIGGSVKRFVRSRIIAQNLIVKSAEDFVNIAKEMEIKVLLMKESEIEQRNNDLGLKQIVKDSSKIQEIKKKHFFSVETLSAGKKISKKVVGLRITPESA